MKYADTLAKIANIHNEIISEVDNFLSYLTDSAVPLRSRWKAYEDFGYVMLPSAKDDSALRVPFTSDKCWTFLHEIYPRLKVTYIDESAERKNPIPECIFKFIRQEYAYGEVIEFPGLVTRLEQHFQEVSKDIDTFKEFILTTGIYSFCNVDNISEASYLGEPPAIYRARLKVEFSKQESMAEIYKYITDKDIDLEERRYVFLIQNKGLPVARNIKFLEDYYKELLWVAGAFDYKRGERIPLPQFLVEIEDYPNITKDRLVEIAEYVLGSRFGQFIYEWDE